VAAIRAGRVGRWPEKEKGARLQLELRGITKRFPGVLANNSVSLTVREGEILGLLGENGAGKTTLMNILYGLYSADEGEIIIDDEVRHFTGPEDAIAAGIGMVHQHLMLVPVFTVTENVALGVEPTKAFGILDLEKARRRVTEISERYGLEVEPDALIEDLPVGVQQRVEIIKVLFREARFLIFDEPTAVLTPQEVEEFFGIVRSLSAAGKGIVFITHKLGEVLEIADRISVLRRGAVVGGAWFILGSVGRFDENMMAGRGFIGLPAMIFGRWHPVGALAAATVFGFADALAGKLGILQTGIPSEFLLMVPALATIVVVAGLVGKSQPPAADGQPYVKE